MATATETVKETENTKIKRLLKASFFYLVNSLVLNLFTILGCYVFILIYDSLFQIEYFYRHCLKLNHQVLFY